MGQTGPLNPATLVFMGTPALAATVLRRVLAWPGGRVAAAYTQPDRPAGRGYALKAPPVKELALEHNIPVFQPRNFKAEADVAALRELAPDFLLVAAYGLILPQRVLDIPAVLPLNVHTSLLPLYRGAAPIQRAVMNGDTKTGVSIMVMDAGMDTGPVLLRREIPIGPQDTAATVHAALANLGGALLIEALEGLLARRLHPVPQDHAKATHAPKLSKADGQLDCALPAAAVDALVRGVTPWPGAYCTLLRPGQENIVIGIESGRPLDFPANAASDARPGDVLGLVDGHLALVCGSGVYGISRLRPAGRKPMDAKAFVNGYLASGQKIRVALPVPSKAQ